ncbi:hypothetical protein [Demequina sediminicola]|uniref:hypothetical protein n=1 Tax=Demequina sediminicola TaxID=1095026 RepID=UPI000784E09F|nr:hypothetical protein [Demequina sediminicola]
MEIPGSSSLHALAIATLDHAVAGAAQGPVEPFVVEEDGAGRRTLTPCPGNTPDAGVARATEHANNSSAQRVAVCFDGFVTLEEGRADAVWVIVHERDDDAAQAFYQRYRTAHSEEGYAVLGNVGYGGENDPLRGDSA